MGRVDMRIDVDKLLDTTVTVVCRLDAKLTGEGQDSYVGLVLSPASWSERVEQSTDADGTVQRRRVVRLQVPVSTADYLTRAELASRAMSGDLSGVYSLSAGDTLIRGNHALTGRLTRSEMLSQTKGLDRVTVTLVRDCLNQGAVDAPATGCLKYVSVVYAEAS